MDNKIITLSEYLKDCKSIQDVESRFYEIPNRTCSEDSYMYLSNDGKIYLRIYGYFEFNYIRKMFGWELSNGVFIFSIDSVTLDITDLPNLANTYNLLLDYKKCNDDYVSLALENNLIVNDFLRNSIGCKALYQLEADIQQDMDRKIAEIQESYKADLEAVTCSLTRLRKDYSNYLNDVSGLDDIKSTKSSYVDKINSENLIIVTSTNFTIISAKPGEC